MGHVGAVNGGQRKRDQRGWGSGSRSNSASRCSTAPLSTERQQPLTEIIWWLVAKFSSRKRCASSCRTRAPASTWQKIASTWSASSTHFSRRRPFRSQNRSISLLMPSAHPTITFILLIGDRLLSSSRSCSMHARYGCSFSASRSFSSPLSTSLLSTSLPETLPRYALTVLAPREKRSLTWKRSGRLPWRRSRTRPSLSSRSRQQLQATAKACEQKTGSLKRMAVQTLSTLSSLAMKRFPGQNSAKLPRLQQSQTASRSSTRNCFTSSTKSPARRLACSASRQASPKWMRKRRRTRASMQSWSARCRSRIIENLRKSSRSLAVWLVISRSLPSTEEMVSSMRELIELRKLIFDSAEFLLSKGARLRRPLLLLRWTLRSIAMRLRRGCSPIEEAIGGALGEAAFEAETDNITERLRLSLKRESSAGVERSSVWAGASTSASRFSAATSAKNLLLGSWQVLTSSPIWPAQGNSCASAQQLSTKAFSQRMRSEWQLAYFCAPSPLIPRSTGGPPLTPTRASLPRRWCRSALRSCPPPPCPLLPCPQLPLVACSP